MAGYPTESLPRVAVFDLDATLLDSADELSPRTAAALQAIADAGVLIVLATERPVAAVVGRLDGHHAHFVVGSNGRELYSFETDHYVSEPDDLDVETAGIDKLAGVRRLTGQLGVRRRDVIAFGAKLGDHGLLSWAGRGIAVADDEHGVAVVLEAFLRDAG